MESSLDEASNDKVKSLEMEEEEESDFSGGLVEKCFLPPSTYPSPILDHQMSLIHLAQYYLG